MYPFTDKDGRLTAKGHSLCLSAEKIVYYHFKHTYLKMFLERDVILQECWFAATLAASRYDTRLEISFDFYVSRGIKFHLKGLFNYFCIRKRKILGDKPTEIDNEGNVLDWKSEREPGLRVWCDEEYSIKRNQVPLIDRLVLYLRYVECLEYRDIGSIWGVTKQNAHKWAKRGIKRISSVEV